MKLSLNLRSESNGLRLFTALKASTPAGRLIDDISQNLLMLSLIKSTHISDKSLTLNGCGILTT